MIVLGALRYGFVQEEMSYCSTSVERRMTASSS